MPSQTTARSSPAEDGIDLSPLQARAGELVRAAMKAGADAADTVVAASRSSGVEVRNGGIEETESSESDAFSLRVFVGHRSASVSANRGGDPLTLAERAVSMAKVSPENPFAGLAGENRLARDFPDLDLFDATVLDQSEMTARALACEAAALGVKGVSKSNGASFGQSTSGTVLATSHGFEGAYKASRFSLSVSAVGGEGTAMERDYDFDSCRHFGDLRSPDDIGLLAGERVVARLKPTQMPTQSIAVIFDPRVARGLVGHLASAINGATVARKTSFLRDAMGKKILRDKLTLVDEPHISRGPGSRPFDGEGLPPEALAMVEDGILKHWFLDGAVARELGLVSNARANRAGSGTSPGSTNLTLLPGQKKPEELMKEIGAGFYVTELIGQGVNMVTGDYSRGASGFRIENGEKTFPVSEVTIAGNLRDMFARMVPASDLEKRFSTNAPTILIEGMKLAGR